MRSVARHNVTDTLNWGRERITEELRGILRGQGANGDLKRSAVLAFAVRIVAAGLAYFSQIALVRLVGAHEYGLFAYVWVWMIILSQIFTLGYGHASVRLVSENLVRKDYASVRGAMITARVVSVGGGGLFALAGFAFIWMFGEQLDNPYLLPFMIAVICLPLMTLEQVGEGIARGFGWVPLALIPPYIVRPVLLLVFLAGAVLIGFEANAMTAAACAILAAFVSSIGQQIAIELQMRKRIPMEKPKYKHLAWAGIAVPLVVVDGSGLLQYHADLIVLSNFVSPEEVAVYFAAAKTIALIALVHFAVAAVANQRFAALNAAEDREALQGFIAQTSHWTFWPAVAAALGFVIMGKPLLWLFGLEFMAGYPVMMILALGFIARAAVGQAEQILNMTGHHRKTAAVLIFGLCLNVALNLAFVPIWGLYGAASATVITTAIQCILAAYFVRKTAGVWPVVGLAR